MLPLPNNIFIHQVNRSLFEFIVIYYRINSTIALLYWNMPDQTWKINMMTLIYLICYVPMTSISSYVMKKHGLRTSIMMAAVLNFVGGWVRCLGYKVGHIVIIIFY